MWKQLFRIFLLAILVNFACAASIPTDAPVTTVPVTIAPIIIAPNLNSLEIWGNKVVRLLQRVSAFFLKRNDVTEHMCKKTL